MTTGQGDTSEESAAAAARPDMVWDAWGVPAGHTPLPEQIRGLLGQVFGVSGPPAIRRSPEPRPRLRRERGFPAWPCIHP
ncbi:hypothetical protein [Nocardia carnea]|uniref:hypothetical protein n=1 Tax=Nocardia carnea TaxID=37328 RepID=UPI0024575981|nr:hypothetical protein [Nocardia carnea]